MANQKAVGVVWLRSFLKNKGTEVEGRFLKMLSPEERNLFNGALRTSWIPVEKVASLFSKASQAMSLDPSHGLRELGRLQALDDLKGVYRVFLLVASIPHTINQAAAMWKTHHNAGVASVETDPAEPHRLTLVVRDYPDYCSDHAEIIAGYIVGTLELAGAKSVAVEYDVSHSDALRWFVTWS